VAGIETVKGRLFGIYDERSEGFVFSESEKEVFEAEKSFVWRGDADLLEEDLRDSRDIGLCLMRMMVHDFHKRERRTRRF
jgi:hypothetical protein